MVFNRRFHFFVKFANQGRFPPKTEKNEARQFVCTSGAMRRVEKKKELPSLRQAYIFLKSLFESAFSEIILEQNHPKFKCKQRHICFSQQDLLIRNFFEKIASTFACYNLLLPRKTGFFCKIFEQIEPNFYNILVNIR